MIEIKNLTKKFGDFTALENVSMKIKDGTIHGLIGYNGAGKTTLLKNVAGIYKPEEGEVLFDGENIFENEKKKSELFLVPDDLYFTPYATMNSMAKFYAGYYEKFSFYTFNNLTKAFGLDPRARIQGFSKGMQRQAELVFALSVHPKYLLMDESFDGIDPARIILMKDILKETVRNDRTSVLISSHNLNELENLCSYVCILNGKTVVLDNAIDEVSNEKTKFRLAFTRQFTLKEFDGLKCYDLKKDGQIATFTVNGDISEAEAFVEKLNPAVTETINLSLNEIFIENMEGEKIDVKEIIR